MSVVAPTFERSAVVAPQRAVCRTGSRTRLSALLFGVGLTAILLSQNAYPLVQWATYGKLFYANADDEPAYLQYDFAKASRAVSRSSEYLVIACHELGLSAGVQNLLFDVVCTLGIAFFVRRTFLAFGFDAVTASRNALLLLVLPLMFGGANPLIQKLYWWNLDSKLITWLSVPQGPYTPLARSPEPQFSLLLLSSASWFAVRRRAYWPIYVCAPFLYAFVVIPVLFTTLTLHGRDFAQRCGWNPRWAPVFAFLFVGGFLGLYHALLVPAATLDFLIPTHSPMLSFSGVLALAIAAVGNRVCRPELRPLLWTVAFAPFVALNQQVISGWLAVPHNHEQYLGVLCTSLACLLVLRGRIANVAAIVVAAALFAHHSYHAVTIGNWVTSRLDWNEELFTALREHSADVAINDINLAMNASMIYPRQPSTAFGFERSYAVVATEANLRRYVAARDEILRDTMLAPQFRELLTLLDEAYSLQGRNFAALHVHRRPPVAPRYDLRDYAGGDSPPKLYVFPLRPASP
jgi:hypothetical protein